MKGVMPRCIAPLVISGVCIVGCSASTTGGPDAGDASKDSYSPLLESSTDAPTTCGPLDVTGFQPTTLVPPNPPHASKCTSQQGSDYAECQAAKMTGLCGQFADGQPGQTCRECIETQSTAARWGVIVFVGSSNGTINVEGCVDDALGETSKEKANGGNGSCGDLLHASYGCQDAACGGCSSDEFGACDDEAVKSGCKSYDQAVQSPTGPCADLLSDAAPPALAACQPDASIPDQTQREVDWLTRMVGYMCGP